MAKNAFIFCLGAFCGLLLCDKRHEYKELQEKLIDKGYIFTAKIDGQEMFFWADESEDYIKIKKAEDATTH